LSDTLKKARRVIFFAHYEVSQFASPYIEDEHLLLGILREDKPLTNRFLRFEMDRFEKKSSGIQLRGRRLLLPWIFL